MKNHAGPGFYAINPKLNCQLTDVQAASYELRSIWQFCESHASFGLRSVWQTSDQGLLTLSLICASSFIGRTERPYELLEVPVYSELIPFVFVGPK